MGHKVGLVLNILGVVPLGFALERRTQGMSGSWMRHRRYWFAPGARWANAACASYALEI
ncbi:MAG TPA: hypothetical protein VGO91_16405 [Pyrinomonadaceae bacterium]|nr:hypothetical protein [Pyrinomonadaceae bacterium]